MSVVIQPLLPITSGDTYIDPLPIIIIFYGGNVRLGATFFELNRPPKGHTLLLLQLQDATSGPPTISI